MVRARGRARRRSATEKAWQVSVLFERRTQPSVGRYSKFVSKGGITGGKDQLRITGGERATLLPVIGFTVPVSALTLGCG